MDPPYEWDLSQYKITVDTSSSRFPRTSTPEVPASDHSFIEKFDLVLSKSSSSAFQPLPTSASSAGSHQNTHNHYYHHQEHHQQQLPDPQSHYNPNYESISPSIRYVPSYTTINFVPNSIPDERKVSSSHPNYHHPQAPSNTTEQEAVFIRPADPVYQFPPTIKSEPTDDEYSKQPYQPQLVMPTSHRIYVNPSVWLSSNRAEYNGVGTPMPVLPTKNYFNAQSSKIAELQIISKKESPNVPIVPTKNVPKRKKKRSKGRKGRNRGGKPPIPTSLSPKKMAQFLLQIQANGNEVQKKMIDNKSINLTKVTRQSTTGIIKSQRKPVDARLWLNAKAQLVAQAQTQSDTNKSSTPIKVETTTKSKHFVDRAASPIDFKDDKIKPKTRDVALSPIRFIQSDFKRRKCHDENTIDLSTQLNTVPLISKCFIRTLRHECFKCKISLDKADDATREDGEVVDNDDNDDQGVDEEGKELLNRSCLTCLAVNALCSSKEKI